MEEPGRYWLAIFTSVVKFQKEQEHFMKDWHRSAMVLKPTNVSGSLEMFAFPLLSISLTAALSRNSRELLSMEMTLEIQNKIEETCWMKAYTLNTKIRNLSSSNLICDCFRTVSPSFHCSCLRSFSCSLLL